MLYCSCFDVDVDVCFYGVYIFFTLLSGLPVQVNLEFQKPK